ncbi:protein ALP1-like [Senna tora]|uniref:Protein ALP1-like n=1 Tax=Senna tora TaxID=362788 RepID=A0A834TKU2_9FABA|nr:protein ALP1-like [Senna tora]
MRHSSARNVIECCFGMLKMRASDPIEEAVIEGNGEGDCAANSTPVETNTISSIETSTAWSNWWDSLVCLKNRKVEVCLKNKMEVLQNAHPPLDTRRGQGTGGKRDGIVVRRYFQCKQ